MTNWRVEMADIANPMGGGCPSLKRVGINERHAGNKSMRRTHQVAPPSRKKSARMVEWSCRAHAAARWRGHHSGQPWKFW